MTGWMPIDPAISWVLIAAVAAAGIISILYVVAAACRDEMARRQLRERVDQMRREYRLRMQAEGRDGTLGAPHRIHADAQTAQRKAA